MSHFIDVPLPVLAELTDDLIEVPVAVAQVEAVGEGQVVNYDLNQLIGQE